MNGPTYDDPIAAAVRAKLGMAAPVEEQEPDIQTYKRGQQVEWPIKGNVSSVKGDKRRNGRLHEDVDIVAPRGTPVPHRPNRPGVVTRGGFQKGGAGNYVVVDDGKNEVMYGHLDRADVKPGDVVQPGGSLGLTGNTGNSTGPHLHMRTRKSKLGPDGVKAKLGAAAPILDPIAERVRAKMAAKAAPAESTVGAADGSSPPSPLSPASQAHQRQMDEYAFQQHRELPAQKTKDPMDVERPTMLTPLGVEYHEPKGLIEQSRDIPFMVEGPARRGGMRAAPVGEDPELVAKLAQAARLKGFENERPSGVPFSDPRASLGQVGLPGRVSINADPGVDAEGKPISALQTAGADILKPEGEVEGSAYLAPPDPQGNRLLTIPVPQDPRLLSLGYVDRFASKEVTAIDDTAYDKLAAGGVKPISGHFYTTNTGKRFEMDDREFRRIVGEAQANQYANLRELDVLENRRSLSQKDGGRLAELIDWRDRGRPGEAKAPNGEIIDVLDGNGNYRMQLSSATIGAAKRLAGKPAGTFTEMPELPDVPYTPTEQFFKPGVELADRAIEHPIRMSTPGGFAKGMFDEGFEAGGEAIAEQERATGISREQRFPNLLGSNLGRAAIDFQSGVARSASLGVIDAPAQGAVPSQLPQDLDWLPPVAGGVGEVVGDLPWFAVGGPLAHKGVEVAVNSPKLARGLATLVRSEERARAILASPIGREMATSGLLLGGLTAVKGQKKDETFAAYVGRVGESTAIGTAFPALEKMLPKSLTKAQRSAIAYAIVARVVPRLAGGQPRNIPFSDDPLVNEAINFGVDMFEGWAIGKGIQLATTGTIADPKPRIISSKLADGTIAYGSYDPVNNRWKVITPKEGKAPEPDLAVRPDAFNAMFPHGEMGVRTDRARQARRVVEDLFAGRTASAESALEASEKVDFLPPSREERDVTAQGRDVGPPAGYLPGGGPNARNPMRAEPAPAIRDYQRELAPGQKLLPPGEEGGGSGLRGPEPPPSAPTAPRVEESPITTAENRPIEAQTAEKPNKTQDDLTAKVDEKTGVSTPTRPTAFAEPSEAPPLTVGTPPIPRDTKFGSIPIEKRPETIGALSDAIAEGKKSVTWAEVQKAVAEYEVPNVSPDSVARMIREDMRIPVEGYRNPKEREADAAAEAERLAAIAETDAKIADLERQVEEAGGSKAAPINIKGHLGRLRKKREKLGPGVGEGTVPEASPAPSRPSSEEPTPESSDRLPKFDTTADLAPLREAGEVDTVRVTGTPAIREIEAISTPAKKSGDRKAGEAKIERLRKRGLTVTSAVDALTEDQTRRGVNPGTTYTIKVPTAWEDRTFQIRWEPTPPESFKGLGDRPTIDDGRWGAVNEVGTFSGSKILADAITKRVQDEVATATDIPQEAGTQGKDGPPAPTTTGRGEPEPSVPEPDAPSQSPTKPGNPFAARAARVRAIANKLNEPTAHDKGMAEHFPHGAGFGRGTARHKRLDRTIDRAVRAVEADNLATQLEAQAAAFDRGEINAQGRRPAKNADEAKTKRDEKKERTRVAKEAREGKELWQVPPSVYTDSNATFGGDGLDLLRRDHRQAVLKALREGRNVPDDVLAEYPDLQGKMQPPWSPGDEHRVMGMDGVVAEAERVGATDFVLLSVDHPKNEAVTLASDAESGSAIEVRSYPSWDAAQKAHRATVEKAQKMEGGSPAVEKRGPERMTDAEWNALGPAGQDAHRKSLEDALEAKEADARKREETDALTGIGNLLAYNRRAAEMEAEGGELHVTLVDDNAMKAFNEGPGYPLGDALIKTTATALTDEGLTPFRIGGDEFAILHRDPETTTPAVEAALTRLRGTEASVIHKDGRKLTVSGMSFAFGTGKGTDAETAKRGANVELAKHKKRLEAEGTDRTGNPLEIPPGVSVRAEGDVPTAGDRPGIGDGDAAAAPSVEPSPAAPAVAVEEPEIDPLARTKADLKRVRKGELSAAEIHAAFDTFLSNYDAITATLMKRTLKELTDNVGGRKKAFIVKTIVDRMGSAYHLDVGISWEPGKEQYIDAVARAVRKQTDADVEAYNKKRADLKKARDNPETLSDFREFISTRGSEALSVEQLARYDKLQAEAERAGQLHTEARKATVAPVDVGDLEMTVTKGTHTKRGTDIWTVTLSRRVERDTYDRLNKAAKLIGGYYSRFGKGFVFESAEAAERFTKVTDVGVDGAAIVEGKLAAKADSAANRLRKTADDLEARGAEELDRDRKTNTQKRAREAGHAEEKARHKVATAKTMRNIADAMDAGELKFLSSLRFQTDVAALEQLWSRALYAQARKEGKESYLDMQKRLEKGADEETIRFAKYPWPAIERSSAVDLHHKTQSMRRFGHAPKQLKAIIDKSDPDKGSVEISNHDVAGVIEKMSDAAYPDGKGAAHIWYADEYRAMQRLGIQSDTHLRAALREFEANRTKTEKPDPVKVAERALIGVPIPGYFPTPPALARELVDKAQIEPGMSVLEPSAGKGSLVEAVLDAVPDADVKAIEQNNQLRAILEGKGIKLTGRDFLEHPAEYDRIVMNPPFENGQDIDHVRYAYDVALKSGGRMVAIMSEGPFSRQSAKDREFRDWLDEVGGTSERNEEGAFKSSDRPTGVSTRTVVIDKPGGPAKASAAGSGAASAGDVVTWKNKGGDWTESGTVVEVETNQSGGRGYSIHAPTDDHPGRVIRVWENQGSVTVTKKAESAELPPLDVASTRPWSEEDAKELAKVLDESGEMSRKAAAAEKGLRRTKYGSQRDGELKAERAAARDRQRLLDEQRDRLLKRRDQALNVQAYTSGSPLERAIAWRTLSESPIRMQTAKPIIERAVADTIARSPEIPEKYRDIALTAGIEAVRNDYFAQLGTTADGYVLDRAKHAVVEKAIVPAQRELSERVVETIDGLRREAVRPNVDPTATMQFFNKLLDFTKPSAQSSYTAYGAKPLEIPEYLADFERSEGLLAGLADSVHVAALQSILDLPLLPSERYRAINELTDVLPNRNRDLTDKSEAVEEVADAWKTTAEGRTDETLVEIEDVQVPMKVAKVLGASGLTPIVDWKKEQIKERVKQLNDETKPVVGKAVVKLHSGTKLESSKEVFGSTYGPFIVAKTPHGRNVTHMPSGMEIVGGTNRTERELQAIAIELADWKDVEWAKVSAKTNNEKIGARVRTLLRRYDESDIEQQDVDGWLASRDAKLPAVARPKAPSVEEAKAGKPDKYGYTPAQKAYVAGELAHLVRNRISDHEEITEPIRIPAGGTIKPTDMIAANAVHKALTGKDADAALARYERSAGSPFHAAAPMPKKAAKVGPIAITTLIQNYEAQLSKEAPGSPEYDEIDGLLKTWKKLATDQLVKKATDQGLAALVTLGPFKRDDRTALRESGPYPSNPYTAAEHARTMLVRRPSDGAPGAIRLNPAAAALYHEAAERGMTSEVDWAALTVPITRLGKVRLALAELFDDPKLSDVARGNIVQLQRALAAVIADAGDWGVAELWNLDGMTIGETEAALGEETVHGWQYADVYRRTQKMNARGFVTAEQIAEMPHREAVRRELVARGYTDVRRDDDVLVLEAIAKLIGAGDMLGLTEDQAVEVGAWAIRSIAATHGGRAVFRYLDRPVVDRTPLYREYENARPVQPRDQRREAVHEGVGQKTLAPSSTGKRAEGETRARNSKALAKWLPGNEEPVSLSATAWHGSPHDFEQFSLQKIGSGEGHQTYGWGLYFAGLKDVAVFYKGKLGGSGFRALSGAENMVLDEGGYTEAIEAVPLGPERRAVIDAKIREVEEDLASDDVGTDSEELRALVKLRDSKDYIVRKPGHLYKVEIPEDPDFLDWDKPLSEQSPIVKEALGKIPQEVWDDIGDTFEMKYNWNPIEGPDDPDYNGMHLYRALQLHEGTLPWDDALDVRETVSRYLGSLGIAGIRYADQGSRGKGSGTANYVVFDDALVKIIGKTSGPDEGLAARRPVLHADPRLERIERAQHDSESPGTLQRINEAIDALPGKVADTGTFLLNQFHQIDKFVENVQFTTGIIPPSENPTAVNAISYGGAAGIVEAVLLDYGTIWRDARRRGLDHSLNRYFNLTAYERAYQVVREHVADTMLDFANFIIDNVHDDVFEAMENRGDITAAERRYLSGLQTGRANGGATPPATPTRFVNLLWNIGRTGGANPTPQQRRDGARATAAAWRNLTRGTMNVRQAAAFWDRVNADNRAVVEMQQRIEDAAIVPEHLSEADIAAAQAQMRTDLTAEQHQFVEDLANRVFELNRQMWDLAYSTGIISTRVYHKTIARGDRYVPLSRIMEALTHGRGANHFKRDSLDLAQQDILHRLEGSGRYNIPPMIASMARASETIREATRNNAARVFLNLRHRDPALAAVIRPMPTGHTLQRGEGMLEVFVDGQRERWIVPDFVAWEMDLATAQNLEIIGGSFIAWWNHIFKAGATGMNLAFALPNVVRDVRAWTIFAEHGPRIYRPDQVATAATQWVASLYHVLLKDDAYREWLRSGGAFSTLQKQFTPGAFLTPFYRDPMKLPAKIATAPYLAIGKVVNALEETTKIAAYRRAINANRRKGMSEADAVIAAVYESRTFGGSPDFAIGGSYGHQINLAYPFFRAALAGIRRNVRNISGKDTYLPGGRGGIGNTGGAGPSGPVASTWQGMGGGGNRGGGGGGMWAPIIGEPGPGTNPQVARARRMLAAMLRLSARAFGMFLFASLIYESQIKKYRSDWDTVLRSEKEKNWIIFSDETETKPNGEEYRPYRKLPMDHFDQVFFPMMLDVLRWAHGEDVEVPAAVLREAEAFSPLTINTGKDESVARAVGRALVSNASPVGREPFEQIANWDTYRDQPIEAPWMEKVDAAQRYNVDKTSPTIVQFSHFADDLITRLTGDKQNFWISSPTRTERFIRSMTGGASDVPLGIADYFQRADKGIPRTKSDELRRAPVYGPLLSRIIGSSANQITLDQTERFYSSYERSQTAMQSFRNEGERSGPDAARAYLDKNFPRAAFAKELDDMVDAQSRIRKAYNDVQTNPHIDDAEKRRQLAELYRAEKQILKRSDQIAAMMKSKDMDVIAKDPTARLFRYNSEVEIEKFRQLDELKNSPAFRKIADPTRQRELLDKLKRKVDAMRLQPAPPQFGPDAEKAYDELQRRKEAFVMLRAGFVVNEDGDPVRVYDWLTTPEE